MKNPALQRKNLYNKDEVEHSHKMAIRIIRLTS